MELHYLAKSPFEQFQEWFREAELKSGATHPNAMCLATVGADGQPSARMVLLKGMDKKGFIFFTNYTSKKGDQLSENPKAALCFHWDALGKQVRVEGRVEKVSRQESEIYFHSRPRGSQLGAWVSEQSREIPSRDFLLRRMEETQKQFPDEVPLPEHWGGYILMPDTLEFWMQQENRLHDRFLYRKNDAGEWVVARLSP